LRHVGFLGAMPPAIKGLADLKFTEGGETMTFEFNENTDPGEFLHQKVIELLNNPPEFSEEGTKIGSSITYSEAFTIVQKRYPEITQKYAESIGQ